MSFLAILRRPRPLINGLGWFSIRQTSTPADACSMPVLLPVLLMFHGHCEGGEAAEAGEEEEVRGERREGGGGGGGGGRRAGMQGGVKAGEEGGGLDTYVTTTHDKSCHAVSWWFSPDVLWDRMLSPWFLI